MGLGFLKVEARTLNDELPVKGATVIIRDKAGTILYRLKTDESGDTQTVRLEAPDRRRTLSPSYSGPYFSTYDVEVTFPENFITEIVKGVQIFDTITSILPVTMIPKPIGARNLVNIHEIPENDLHSSAQRNQEDPPATPFSLNEVLIPEYLIVHLGPPNSTARNVKVKFTDYIKNVASSEIYPTWPQASLEANIYAIITFALNRVFTEWYKSRGFNFDITNSTSVDQAFIEGRDIFANISLIVDRIFNSFVRRRGRLEPFFTQFCNGTTSTCPGLSQWGTVTLANQGLDPLQILRYYYPNDVEIATSNNIGGITESYPGRPLLEGSQGEDVRTMQRYLNRIRTNYPLIPLIPNPNGIFGPETTSAVKTFQKIFDLPQDGVIGRGTWYKIVQIFVGIVRLAELTSEGIRIGIGDTPPNVVLSSGSKGEHVVELQFILNYISEFYAEVPPVIQNAVFDTTTKNAVIEFQRLFGLTPDGIVGPVTWTMLYNVFKGIEDNIEVPLPPEITPPVPPTTQGVVPAYPGTPLRIGSTGINVLIMQEFLNVLSSVYPSIPKLTADASFGNITQSAVTAFQKQFGLTADGIIGPVTWNRIVTEYTKIIDSSPAPYPGTPLRVGSRGANVVLMQRYLNDIRKQHPSIPNLIVDGIFGSHTESAVATFQRLFNLGTDGIIGPITWNRVIDVWRNM